MRAREATQLEIVYLAGVLDGEGTFTVYRAGTNYHALVAVASTSEELISWVRDRFNGSVSETSSPSGNREAAWQWQLRIKEEIVTLLPRVIPFLVVKKLQAQLFLKYCTEFIDSRRGQKLSKETLELRDAYCTLFADLNAVGRGSAAKKAKVIEMFSAGGIAL